MSDTMSDFNTMWNNALKEMISAIKSDNNIYDFFIEYEPDDDTGYAWTQDKNYKYFSDILEKKTNSTGHSGASFACCVREAVDIIRKEVLVVADEVSNTDNNITTLEPIN
jgi:hypothetical protein